MADAFNCNTNSVESIFTSPSIHYLHPFYINQTVTAIKDQSVEKNSISIFPVPASEFITVKFNDGSKNTISIVDVRGQLIINKEINGSDVIDIKKLEPGIYFIISQTHEFLPQKFIKE